jgi:hypothetical protein
MAAAIESELLTSLRILLLFFFLQRLTSACCFETNRPIVFLRRTEWGLTTKFVLILKFQVSKLAAIL